MLANSRTFIFTFLFAITLLIALVPPHVDASPAPAVLVSPAHRRQADRMVKKRQLDILGVGEDPSSSASDTATRTAAVTETATATGGTSTTTSASSSTTTSGTATVTSTSATSTSSSSSSSSTTSSSSSSASSSSSSSSSTSSSSSSSATSTSSEVTSATPAPDAAQTTSSRQLQTVTNTVSSSDEAASATESAETKGASSSSVSKTTITVIAVIGGCVGAAVIIWTIVRKWKFRPSAEFEDRMQPIDWSPETNHSDVGHGLQRAGSNASHGSFHSGSNHDGLAGPRPYGATGAGGLVSDLPSHDFTAGPAHLGGGYADLQRGPSPGPQMTSVGRGPSFNRGYGY